MRSYTNTQPYREPCDKGSNASSISNTNLLTIYSSITSSNYPPDSLSLTGSFRHSHSRTDSSSHVYSFKRCSFYSILPFCDFPYCFMFAAPRLLNTDFSGSLRKNQGTGCPRSWSCFKKISVHPCSQKKCVDSTSLHLCRLEERQSSITQSVNNLHTNVGYTLRFTSSSASRSFNVLVSHIPIKLHDQKGTNVKVAHFVAKKSYESISIISADPAKSVDIEDVSVTSFRHGT